MAADEERTVATLEELNEAIGEFFEDFRGRVEAHAQQVNFRLERMEQGLLIFAGEAGNNPTHAASELARILRLNQAEFTDAALATPPTP